MQQDISGAYRVGDGCCCGIGNAQWCAGSIGPGFGIVMDFSDDLWLLSIVHVVTIMAEAKEPC